MNTAPAAFALTDNTLGRTWPYGSEAQLRTVTKLYAASHPRASLSVTINGTTTRVR